MVLDADSSDLTGPVVGGVLGAVVVIIVLIIVVVIVLMVVKKKKGRLSAPVYSLLVTSLMKYLIAYNNEHAAVCVQKTLITLGCIYIYKGDDSTSGKEK